MELGLLEEIFSIMVGAERKEELGLVLAWETQGKGRVNAQMSCIGEVGLWGESISFHIQNLSYLWAPQAETSGEQAIMWVQSLWGACGHHWLNWWRPDCPIRGLGA